MSGTRVIELAECRELAQALRRGPSLRVHATLALITGLLVAAVVWASVTQAHLVVEGRGRVRPVETPRQIYVAIAPSMVGRVIEKHFNEGDFVKKGTLLLRLDTERLDNEIEKQTRMIGSAELELESLNLVENLQRQASDAQRAKGEVELHHAEAEVDQNRARSASEVRQLEAELTTVRDRATRMRELVANRVVTAQEFIETRAKVRDVEERLNRARLPVDASSIDLAERALSLIERDDELQQARIGRERVIQQRELETARRKLADLELQRAEALVLAPIDGVVIKGEVRVGDILRTEQPVLEIARQQGLHFELSLPTKDAGRLRAGMAARIRFDAFDHHEYGTLPGRVCYISPDSNLSAQSAGAPAYVVRVALERDTIGAAGASHHVRLGLAGTAEIITERRRLITILLGRIRQTISLN